ncbi:phosphatidylserine decarboxylase [Gemella sanguinis]|uniref:Phosphatidylserine decarboxylase n=1 Tax=Gemella sanguinis TaxID=84135 RepID=A0ABX6FKP4_9BACL|nr:phosphatidylserine decarboxylase [Gemella sanguinis]QGS08352.1 phosphatidylserine decarboxylase [Gemella sanguinis]
MTSDSLDETRLFCEYKLFGTNFGTKNKMTSKKAL